MIPSERQTAIYHEWEHGDANMLIQSVAGSGKTTTLLELVRRAEYRTLFLAFNKSIQTEIQEYLDYHNLPQGKAMTLHALGLQAIRKRFRYRMNKNKNYDIVKAVLDQNPDIFKYMRWEDKAKYMFTLIDMNDVSRIYLTNDMEEIQSYMIAMDKAFSTAEEMPVLWEQFLEEREKYYTGRKVEIDFIDMIYLPIVKQLYIPIEPTYLMIDEAQDLNLAQHAFIDRLLSQGHIERWVAVGDRNQAIYGFSGAYASSFDLFKQKENVKEFPLDICYRCPVDVLEKANEVYDIMTGFKTHTGKVGTITEAVNIKNNSMVICRNTAPLLNLYFELIGLGRKVFIKGDDILGKIRSFLKPFKKKSVRYVFTHMEAQLDKLENRKDEAARFERYKIQDNLDNLRCLINGGITDYTDIVENMFSRLDAIFQESDSGIVLCTIHKSKGLEADIVYILNEKLIPSKYARSEEQLRQEENLRYVARTRAKEELYNLEL